MKQMILLPVLAGLLQSVTAVSVRADVKTEQELLHAIVQNQVGEVKRLPTAYMSGVLPS
jgi:hypothetical protein